MTKPLIGVDASAADGSVTFVAIVEKWEKKFADQRAQAVWMISPDLDDRLDKALFARCCDHLTNPSGQAIARAIGQPRDCDGATLASLTVGEDE